MNEFSSVPDILKKAKPELEQPWTLRRIGELLEITYHLAEYPILKGWQSYDPIDIFGLAMIDLEKYKRFNRTLIERI